MDRRIHRCINGCCVYTYINVCTIYIQNIFICSFSKPLSLFPNEFLKVIYMHIIFLIESEMEIQCLNKIVSYTNWWEDQVGLPMDTGQKEMARRTAGLWKGRNDRPTGTQLPAGETHLSLCPSSQRRGPLHFQRYLSAHPIRWGQRDAQVTSAGRQNSEPPAFWVRRELAGRAVCADLRSLGANRAKERLVLRAGIKEIRNLMEWDLAKSVWGPRRLSWRSRMGSAWWNHERGHALSHCSYLDGPMRHTGRMAFPDGKTNATQHMFREGERHSGESLVFSSCS